MSLDIRLPIGLFFIVVGALLAAEGALGDASMNVRSLGLNINLGWGAIMIVTGSVLLWLCRRSATRAGTPKPRAAGK